MRMRLGKEHIAQEDRREGRRSYRWRRRRLLSEEGSGVVLIDVEERGRN